MTAATAQRRLPGPEYPRPRNNQGRWLNIQLGWTMLVLAIAAVVLGVLHLLVSIVQFFKD